MRFVIFSLIYIVQNPAFSQLFGGQIKANQQVLPQYPIGSVFCASGSAAIVDVTNPITGRIWMDRNLGATQAATTFDDANSYGDIYQWGRRSDGHQCRNSAWTSTLSSIDQPTHGNFIIPCDPAQCGSGGTGIIMNPTGQQPFDWRSPENIDLWQGVNGINNPCPSGYRIPTQAEFSSERLTWSTPDGQGAFGSVLKLPFAGGRNLGGPSNTFSGVGTYGYYWVSDISGSYSQALRFRWLYSDFISQYRATGFSIRCIKN